MHRVLATRFCLPNGCANPSVDHIFPLSRSCRAASSLARRFKLLKSFSSHLFARLLLLVLINRLREL
ncbi:hypothetical protein L596_008285 [Steinernema carpocapsae]|uniref:Uncharacterized protein n=1 Tax=Steinernema carpocapsae TaxID=34508 RepID=A0A4U5PC03_STECR|nr:hypothetical protein L596_008285 [Steinernema carpocapsae]